jgi:hypothetical protein
MIQLFALNIIAKMKYLFLFFLALPQKERQRPPPKRSSGSPPGKFNASSHRADARPLNFRAIAL